MRVSCLPYSNGKMRVLYLPYSNGKMRALYLPITRKIECMPYNLCTLQGFKPVAQRHAQILQLANHIEHPIVT